jgi:hypothetical protein
VDDDRIRFGERRPPYVFALPALVVPVAVCGIPGHTGSLTRLAAEGAVLCVLAAVVGFETTVPVGLVAVACSVLSLNGFAEDSYGQLGWHPGVDLAATAALAGAWAVAYAARRGLDRGHPPVAARTGPYRFEEPDPEDGNR